MGEVKDIVYREGQSPQTNDQPAYVLVNFPTYSGPAFIKEFPTYVPIPPIEIRCDYNCCTRKQIPLNLSFGKTVHTFQGSNVGPTRPGQPVNQWQSAVCDPGSKSFEGSMAIGLFYTICSRCTTIGPKDDHMKSALFFRGNDMTHGRIANLLIGKDGKEFLKVKARRKWVEHLNNHSKSPKFTKKEQKCIIKEFTKRKISVQKLEKIIENNAKK